MAAVLTQREKLARLAAGLAALATALGSLAIAIGPGRNTTYEGYSTLAATLSVGAGVGLVLAGLVTSFFGSGGRTGDLAVLAGVVWFTPVWVGWHNGPPLIRSVAMFAAFFALPLFMHLILAAPSGRLRGAAARALVLTVYLEAGLVAVALGLIQDPLSTRVAGPTAPTTCSCFARCLAWRGASSRRTDGSPSSQRSL